MVIHAFFANVILAARNLHLNYETKQENTFVWHSLFTFFIIQTIILKVRTPFHAITGCRGEGGVSENIKC